MTRTLAQQPIDTDSHIVEPADLWTSRVSSKWGDLVPHVRRHEPSGEDVWFIGDEALSPAAVFANVGWREGFPQYPPTFDDAVTSTYDAVERLRLLDEAGIKAQVIYPNLVAGFFANRFMHMEPQLALECVKAYNDFQVDFCSVAPDRLIALTAVPFWDVEASVAEIERCVELGHRGVLFAHSFGGIGLPDVWDERWEPILGAAQSLGQSINFHVGFSADIEKSRSANAAWMATRLTPPRVCVDRAALSFVSNTRAINLVIVYGVCQRFPDLKFVLVESGFGYVPYQLQALDWQWDNNGMARENPDWLLPSDYFRRQMYATLWFETPPTTDLLAWQDNVMWETDYPHPTAQWPTPASTTAMPVPDAIEHSLSGLDDTVRRKIVHDNAAALYRIP